MNLGYRKLNVWIKAKQLCLYTYDITKKFPKEELYALTSQIRRAVISIPSNIAEGCAKNSLKEQLRFIEISCGSYYELTTQMEIAKDINYINDKQYEEFLKVADDLGRLLFGYKKSLCSRIEED